MADVKRKIGVMYDIESLDLGPRSVVTQIGMMGFDMDSEEILQRPIESFLPIQPQLDLIHPRTISAKTLWWWMQQSVEARAKFEYSLDEDFEALPILMRHMIMGFNRLTNDGKADYTIFARGPQFDIVNLESLCKDCGLTPPWKHNRIEDLRTLLNRAGMTKEDEAKLQSPDHVPHSALSDCRHQISMLFEANRRIGSSL